MLFKLSYTVDRLDIHSEEILNFKFKGVDNIQLFVRAPTNEERSKGHQSFNAFFDVLSDFEPTQKAYPVFNALIEGRRPPEGEKANCAEDMIHRTGPSYGLDDYPNPFATFIDEVNTRLSSIGREFIKILRWRHAQEGPPAPISHRGFYCSNDNGNSWHRLPMRTGIRNITPRHSVLEFNKIDYEKTLELLESNFHEPVGHELLREAKELEHRSPRSAVLLAVSALEVATKSVILSKAPHAAWFVENIQSPPLVSILIDYIPSLFPDEKIFYERTKERGVIKTIYDAVTIRNEIAHKGFKPPKDEKVSEIIAAVEKLLWVCDYYSGHKWCEQHITRSSA